MGDDIEAVTRIYNNGVKEIEIHWFDDHDDEDRYLYLGEDEIKVVKKAMKDMGW